MAFCRLIQVRLIMNKDADKTKEQLIAELEELRDSSKKREEALKESEDRLTAVVNASPDGIGISDLNGIIEFVSPETIAMWGYSKEEFIGKHIHEFIHEKSHGTVDHMIGELLKGNNLGTLEYDMVRKDGTIFICEANCSLLYDKNNNPEKVLYIQRDITERKQAEEVIHQRDNYLSALNQANDILFAGNFDEQLSEFVKIVGELSQASRTYIFKNHTDETESLFLSQMAEYVAPGVKPEIDNPELQNLAYEDFLPRWKKRLAKGDIISGNVAEFPENEREILAPQDIKAILVIPIIAETEFWGFIGFDNCQDNTEWDKVQVEYLRAASQKLENGIVDLKNREKLENENKRFHATLDALDAVVYVSDMETHELLFVNKYITDIHGEITG